MKVEPFLFRFAVDRQGVASALPGSYSAERSLWIVDSNEGEVPLVQSELGTRAETQTKTMTQVESDDDDQGRGALMETTTITKVGQEADDIDAPVCIPELATKTEVEQESDDQSSMVVQGSLR